MEMEVLFIKNISNKTYIKQLIFLAFIFLSIQIKAEFYNSAFSASDLQKEQDSIITIRKYELAKINYEQEKYTKALKLILPLIDKDIKDPEFKVKINILAGKIFRKAGDLSKALMHLKKSLKLNEEKFEDFKGDSQFLLADNYLQLSLVFKKLKKIDSSKYFLNELINLNSINDTVQSLKGTAFMNLGNMQAVEGNLNEAEKNMLKSIKIKTNLKNDNMELVLGYMNLANLYVERKQFNKGKEIYGKALTYLKNDKSLMALGYKEILYDNIAWALYNLKDYKAYEFVTDSYAIRDSLNTNKLKKDLKRIEAEHNVDIVKKAEEVKRLQLERKTWIIGITGVLVSLLFLYLANLYKLRQRNLSLKLSQNELKQQRKLERLKSQSQVKILNATIDGKETERKQIAEILHDNVSALLSSASMHLQASQKQFNGHTPLEIAKTQEIINEASQKIRDLSHNLMSSILLKFGLEYAVKDAAKKFSNSSIKINTAIHNVYRYSQDYEIKIFNIIQELINNILKHSSAKNAYIIMEEEEETMNIIVKDDGVGFKNKKEGEKGVGLNQIKARIHMMNGTFLIESSKGQGTKAIIKIPVVRKKAPKKHLA
ncbi:tetratricopeptide repeat-containing sensor histidine kinase [Tenacibaculum amylolyticum]|uniref:tetratricopeptide repeat-containing sensor histidine kinase n=1 Tax=Tenacibaculum amylolyticum TaxID=104269 RepID=UPI003894440A